MSFQSQATTRGPAQLQVITAGAGCPHTGISKPECSCPVCHIELMRRFAPKNVSLGKPRVDLGAPLIPLERYAAQRGMAVDEVKREAAERRVIV
jgi:hypothetical protein